MGTRKSQVEIKALKILQGGKSMCKYDLAAYAHCDQRTAQRILARIHKAGQARILKWASIYRHWIPVYAAGRGADCKRPPPITPAESAARRRRDLEVRWEQMMQKRLKRLRERSEREAPITITRTWNNV